MVNVVGDHAGYHLKHDAPLQSDLDGVANSVSHWVRRANEPGELPDLGAEAIRRARGGEVATIILPADSAWGDTNVAPVHATPPAAKHIPDANRIEAAARALCEPGAALLPGNAALIGDGAELVGRIAARTGARLIAPFFAARMELGDGAVEFEHMFYAGDPNAEFLKDVKRLVCVGAAPPVNFFAYPGKPSTPEPAGCVIDRLSHPDWDTIGTLEALAKAAGVDGTEDIARVEKKLPELAPGPLAPEGIGRALARSTPEGAIMVNEAVTAGFGIWPQVNFAARHDRINTTGGSIGQCLPASLGAAVACPDRPVFAVSGDGSAMYQVQTLWTAARERLNITFIIIANRGYQILHHELIAQGAQEAGRNARAMFDIEDPLLDWQAIAQGHGVPSARATTEDEMASALSKAAATEGPFLIEAVI